MRVIGNLISSNAALRLLPVETVVTYLSGLWIRIASKAMTCTLSGTKELKNQKPFDIMSEAKSFEFFREEIMVSLTKSATPQAFLETLMAASKPATCPKCKLPLSAFSAKGQLLRQLTCRCKGNNHA